MIKNLKEKKNNKGFTLVELLVVIAIIGILAVVAVPALYGNINKSKVAKLESEYSAIKNAVVAEYANTSVIQTDISKLEVEGLKSTTNSPVGGTYSIVTTGMPQGVVWKAALKITTPDNLSDVLTKLQTDLGDGNVSTETTNIYLQLMK